MANGVSNATLELDSAAIAKTKNQIGGLVAEIASLAQKPLSIEAFADDMLMRVVQSMGAVGAALWRIDSVACVWNLVHHYQFPSLLRSEAPDETFDRTLAAIEETLDRTESLLGERSAFHLHCQLQQRVYTEQQPIFIPPGPGFGTESSHSGLPKNPLSQSLIFVPVPVSAELGKYWIEVIQPPAGGVATSRGYLRFVAQIADLTADFLKNKKLRGSLENERVQHISNTVMEDLNRAPDGWIEFSRIIDNLSELIECDQLFLVERLPDRPQWKTCIASRLATFDKNSEGARCIAEAAKEFCCTRFASRSIHQSAVGFSRQLVQLKDRREESSQQSPDYDSSQTSFDKILDSRSLIRHQTFDAIRDLFHASHVAWLPLHAPSIIAHLDRKASRGHAPAFALVAYWAWQSPAANHLTASATSSPNALDQQDDARCELDDRLSEAYESIECAAATTLRMQVAQQLAITALKTVNRRQLKMLLHKNRKPPSKISRFLAKNESNDYSIIERSAANPLAALLSRPLMISYAIAAIAGIMICIPVTSNLTAPATLVASVQQRFYAPRSGRIAEIQVDHGSKVVVGQILLVIKDDELLRSLEETRFELKRLELRSSDLESRLLRDKEIEASDRLTLETELQGVRTLLPQAKVRLELLERQSDELIVRSKSNGIVTTWNARQTLQDRLVAIGQLLLSVQTDSQRWYVDLQIPQYKAGDFIRQLEHADKLDQNFEGSFALVNHPSSKHRISRSREYPLYMQGLENDDPTKSYLVARFEFDKASDTARIEGENFEQQNVQSSFAFKDQPLTESALLSGSAAIAKIPLGTQPLGKVLFGDMTIKLWGKWKLWTGF